MSATPATSSGKYLPWRLLSGLPVLALAACTSFKDIPPNAPLSEALAVMGKPSLTCSLPNHAQRLIWSTQPLGQYAWRTDVNADNHIDRVIPILTDEAFAALQTGRWTQQDVLCAFGPPAESESIGLPSVRQIVWSYRYRQNGVWNSLMYVYFGSDGEYVTRTHPGPDPMYEPDRLLGLH